MNKQKIEMNEVDEADADLEESDVVDTSLKAPINNFSMQMHAKSSQ